LSERAFLITSSHGFMIFLANKLPRFISLHTSAVCEDR